MDLTKDVEPRMRPELRRTDALRTAGMAGTFRRIFLFALYVLCASMASVNAFAQGCAMCYTTAAAAGPRGARAPDPGILVLLFPTPLFFLSGFWFARTHAA